MVRGLSYRPNLTEGPAATWDFRRSIKEEEDDDLDHIVARIGSSMYLGRDLDHFAA
jgi:hypothetical protein